jgi:hypothetical protein
MHSRSTWGIIICFKTLFYFNLFNFIIYIFMSLLVVLHAIFPNFARPTDFACPTVAIQCRVGYFENAIPYHTFCPNQID